MKVWVSHLKSTRYWISFCFQEITANIFLFKVNDRNANKRCEICLKLTIIMTNKDYLGLNYSNTSRTFRFDNIFLTYFTSWFLSILIQFLNFMITKRNYFISKFSLAEKIIHPSHSVLENIHSKTSLKSTSSNNLVSISLTSNIMKIFVHVWLFTLNMYIIARRL